MLTLARNEQEAEDIAQETFLRDLNAKESFSVSLFLPQTNELNRQAGRRAEFTESSQIAERGT